jgi:hypothetical protein
VALKGRAGVQAMGGVRAKPGQKNVGVSATDLISVCRAEDLGPNDGDRKAVDIPGTKDSLMLLRHRKKVLAVGTGCTKCKFPLLNADITEDQGEISCKGAAPRPHTPPDAAPRPASAR